MNRNDVIVVFPLVDDLYNWTGDPDVQIVLHSQLSFVTDSFWDNEAFLQTGYDVVIIPAL